MIKIKVITGNKAKLTEAEKKAGVNAFEKEFNDTLAEMHEKGLQVSTVHFTGSEEPCALVLYTGTITAPNLVISK